MRNIHPGTLLIQAAYKGDLPEVQALVASGVSPNSAFKDGRTALMAAVLSGNIDCVRELIEAGANLNVTDSHDISALMFAASRGFREIVAMFLSAGALVNLQMFNAGTNIMSGKTALMYAMNCEDENHLQIAKDLLEAGAMVNAQDGNGVTALIVAVENQNAEAIQLLLANGADLNLRGHDGMTALETAELMDFHSIIQLLNDWPPTKRKDR